MPDDLRLDNLRAAFHALVLRVETAVRTQVGDAERLQQSRSQCLSLSRAVEQVECCHTTSVITLVK